VRQEPPILHQLLSLHAPPEKARNHPAAQETGDEVNITFNWPNGIMTFLLFLSVFCSAMKHGQPKGTWNGGYALADTVVFLVLLIWGGFYK